MSGSLYSQGFGSPAGAYGTQPAIPQNNGQMPSLHAIQIVQTNLFSLLQQRGVHPQVIETMSRALDIRTGDQNAMQNVQSLMNFIAQSSGNADINGMHPQTMMQILDQWAAQKVPQVINMLQSQMQQQQMMQQNQFGGQFLQPGQGSPTNGVYGTGPSIVQSPQQSLGSAAGVYGQQNAPAQQPAAPQPYAPQSQPNPQPQNGVPAMNAPVAPPVAAPVAASISIEASNENINGDVTDRLATSGIRRKFGIAGHISGLAQLIETRSGIFEDLDIASSVNTSCDKVMGALPESLTAGEFVNLVRVKTLTAINIGLEDLADLRTSYREQLEENPSTVSWRALLEILDSVSTRVSRTVGEYLTKKINTKLLFDYRSYHEPEFFLSIKSLDDLSDLATGKWSGNVKKSPNWHKALLEILDDVIEAFFNEDAVVERDSRSFGSEVLRCNEINPRMDGYTKYDLVDMGDAEKAEFLNFVASHWAIIREVEFYATTNTLGVKNLTKGAIDQANPDTNETIFWKLLVNAQKQARELFPEYRGTLRLFAYLPKDSEDETLVLNARRIVVTDIDNDNSLRVVKPLV